ncbi:MAG: Na+/H+ antiporter [Gemmatimonadetes bacterium]|nr:Na+/H+ antiporter [Gemmatimonadota bacterium]
MPTVAHVDPIAVVLLALAVILAAAKLGGSVAEWFAQPAVLGELIVGVILGNLPGLAGQWSVGVRDDPMIGMLASIGAVILLFEVGLESTLRDMLRVGVRSLVVAALGVIVPWVLGYLVGRLLLPDHSVYVHVFLGATLTATSVGITARVLKDLGHAQTLEARIILGAAVIDDVIGLVILAVVGSILSAANLGTTLSLGAAAMVLAKALGFLVCAFTIGAFLSPKLFAVAARLPTRGTLLTTALAFCFLLSALASLIGLAPIVGAYAAGLILEEAHYSDFTQQGEHRVEELVRPISLFLVPVFFVLMGMRVELSALTQPGILGLAALLTVVAIVGKQACALGGIGAPVDRTVIGIGMIPRGEVGLIFANIGLGLTVRGERVVDERIFAAVVVAVMMTTLVTPPALKWRLASVARRRAA